MDGCGGRDEAYTSSHELWRNRHAANAFGIAAGELVQVARVAALGEALDPLCTLHHLFLPLLVIN